MRFPQSGPSDPAAAKGQATGFGIPAFSRWHRRNLIFLSWGEDTFWNPAQPEGTCPPLEQSPLSLGSPPNRSRTHSLSFHIPEVLMSPLLMGVNVSWKESE